MAQTTLIDIVSSWKEFGVFDFLLPFVIMFSIFYALLNKTKIFGDSYPPKGSTDDQEKKKAKLAKFVNLIVSFGAAMYIMANVGTGANLTLFLYTLFGTSFEIIASLIVITVVAVFAYGVYKGESPFKDDGPGMKTNWTTWGTIVLILAIILPLFNYFTSTGQFSMPEIFDIRLNPFDVSLNDILAPYMRTLGVADLFLRVFALFIAALLGYWLLKAMWALKP